MRGMTDPDGDTAPERSGPGIGLSENDQNVPKKDTN